MAREIEKDLLKCRVTHSILSRIRLNSTALKYMQEFHDTLCQKILDVESITTVEISHITGSILIYHNNTLSVEDICELVESLISNYSYSAIKMYRSEMNSNLVEERNLHEESVGELVRSVLLTAASLGISFLTKSASQGGIMNGRSLLNFPSISTIWLSIPIFKSGFHSLLKTRRPNADTLSSAAIIASVATGYAPSALMLLLLHDSAELLTAYTMDRTRKMIGKMISHGEESVWFENSDGKVEKRPVDSIVVDDIIVVHCGEKISVDGVVISGEGSVDQSSITGEYLPISAHEGSAVFAGTLMKAGTIRVKTEKVGENTTVANIVKMVEDATENRAQVQVYADRYSSQLLLINMLLSGIVFAVSRNWARSLSMLVIDFSCGIRLSTAAAFSAAISTAARNGVLIKGSSYLEVLSEADTLILDKTGTITKGKPEVTSVIPQNGDYSADDILGFAAACEETSAHPMANAIIKKCKTSGISIPKHNDIHVHVSRGVETKVERSIIRVGNKKFMNENGIHTHPMREKVKNLVMAGENIIYISRGKKLIGIIGVADQLRDNMKKSLNRLRNMGVDDIVMLTGDMEQQAEIVANRMALDRFSSELLPEDKARTVLELHYGGSETVMVGDGINDAAALAHADVGIALGNTRTDIAMEAADITITGDNPMMLPALYTLSNQTMRTIRQNFVSVLTINSIGLLLGGIGVLPVFWGAVLHNSSTILVVANSLRLLRFEMKK